MTPWRAFAWLGICLLGGLACPVPPPRACFTGRRLSGHIACCFLPSLLQERRKHALAPSLPALGLSVWSFTDFHLPTLFVVLAYVCPLGLCVFSYFWNLIFIALNIAFWRFCFGLRSLLQLLLLSFNSLTTLPPDRVLYLWGVLVFYYQCEQWPHTVAWTAREYPVALEADIWSRVWRLCWPPAAEMLPWPPGLAAAGLSLHPWLQASSLQCLLPSSPSPYFLCISE